MYIWQVFWGGKNLEECQDWNYPRLSYQSLSDVYLSFYLSIYLTVTIWLPGWKIEVLVLNYFGRFLCCPCYGFSVVVVSTIFFRVFPSSQVDSDGFGHYLSHSTASGSDTQIVGVGGWYFKFRDEQMWKRITTFILTMTTKWTISWGVEPPASFRMFLQVWFTSLFF